jgi:hypothetical protein
MKATCQTCGRNRCIYPELANITEGVAEIAEMVLEANALKTLTQLRPYQPARALAESPEAAQTNYRPVSGERS